MIEGEGVVASEVTRIVHTATTIGLNAFAVPGFTDLYSAQLANGKAAPGVGFFTDLKLINTSAVERTVTISAVDEQGSRLFIGRGPSRPTGMHNVPHC